MGADLREAVAGLMDRAKADLAELVAFKSVADPKLYPPEECRDAAQWVVDAFVDVGLRDVAMSPTIDGSMAVHGHADAPDGAPTVLLYSHVVMHLTALRALKQVDGTFPCGAKVICEGSEEQGTGGLEAFAPENADLLRATRSSSSTPATSPSASRR